MTDHPIPAGQPRGYSWPPFEKGNTAARRHGAYSERELGPMAEQIATVETTRAPWLAVDAFTGHVAQLAKAEAIAAKLWADLEEHGLLDADGNPRPALAALDRWIGRAAKLRGEAGLTPTAWARQIAALSSSGDAGTGQLDGLRNVGAAILAEIEARATEGPGAIGGGAS